MAVSEDRKFTKEQVYNLLEGAKGKTLGEVDKSHQFARTLESTKITGIAGDVIEQSVFGYKKDSKQECDIEIDGVLTEVKTTGVRVPKRDQKNANGKTGEAYNVYLGAKEGISITHDCCAQQALLFHALYQGQGSQGFVSHPHSSHRL